MINYGGCWEEVMVLTEMEGRGRVTDWGGSGPQTGDVEREPVS